MDTTHTDHEQHDDPAAHGPGEHAHPGAAEYVKVAIVLAVLTWIEIALFYITSLPQGIVTFLLLFLMVFKFALVALWFMHLKFDNRLFRRLFITGLILALSVFFIVLLTFGILS